MKHTILAVAIILFSSAFAQQTSVTIQGKTSLKEALKKAVVKMVKSESALKSYYVTAMDDAFSFLDPEDPVRQSAHDIENLGDYSLSTWHPRGGFRYGQGDYDLCSTPREVASVEFGTSLVGFDTSYKREQTYGFWSVVRYFYNFCEKDGEITRARIDVEHLKWLDSKAVDGLLEESIFSHRNSL
jgi:hypothetical protein